MRVHNSLFRLVDICVWHWHMADGTWYYIQWKYTSIYYALLAPAPPPYIEHIQCVCVSVWARYVPRAYSRGEGEGAGVRARLLSVFVWKISSEGESNTATPASSSENIYFFHTHTREWEWKAIYCFAVNRVYRRMPGRPYRKHSGQTETVLFLLKVEIYRRPRLSSFPPTIIRMGAHKRKHYYT